MAYRVGVLTLFKSNNYGTFLQCYSLVKKLMKYKDLEVEVINCVIYNSEKNLFFDILKDRYSKTNSIKTFLRYLKLRNLMKKKLPLSKESFVGYDYEKAMDFINRQNYDYIIAGSDEIWGIFPGYMFPNMYWLNNKIQAGKISYAASTNRTDFTLFSDEDKKFISETLRTFEYLGARDNTTIEQLSNIDNSLDFKKNPDPTFMYEFESTPNLLNKLTKKYKLNPEKPVIAVTMRNPILGKAIMKRFGTQFEIVSIFRSNPYIKKYIYDLDYFEWAKVFSYFSGIVTDLYHGTIFSIRNGTPFVSVDDSDLYLHYPGKIEDLLYDTGLGDCYFNMKNANFDIDLMLDKLQSNMNMRDPQYKLMQNISEYKRKEAENCINKIVKTITDPKHLEKIEEEVNLAD
ncbi:MAG: polysaccharide pyruvyl transferase family protein [Candidatus Gastranaerophilales bacterium]|nr:polysaccharide pyruvyl transferase family protein [Candidatus Gastranaerophilales bacterium]